MTAIAKSSVEISTTRYEFSHGKRPRGEGYWIFTSDRLLFETNGTYGAAAKAAREYFAARGARHAKVEP